MRYEFMGHDGDFKISNPQNNSYLYMPIAGKTGVLANITPDGHGDNKLSQNEFLLEPVSVQNLHESMSSRNFWCTIKNFGPWSVFGYSAGQMAKKNDEDMTLEAGLLWQKIRRRHKMIGLLSEATSFCPVDGDRAEIMRVVLKNTGTDDISFVPTVAVPVFARGADHIRDHRHVTSLLNRISVTADGIEVCPTMAFDERGHHINRTVYGVYAAGNDGSRPVGAYPTIEMFTGEGGNLLVPEAVLDIGGKGLSKKGTVVCGYEAMGALRFSERVLKPEEQCSYTIVMSYNREGCRYLKNGEAEAALNRVCDCWQKEKIVSCRTGSTAFDNWLTWVSIQPQLRKLYGCSFLPYHDYGRGGRGWRDLWQDCLALILKKPFLVRTDMLQFFAGVRPDGSNATIIGSRPGEFKADRNNISRVWMDHGFWPLLTVKLYLDQTGDKAFLTEENTYFKDKMICRGESVDFDYEDGVGTVLLQADGSVYKGTVIEHLIVEQVTQFYDVGSHGHMRLCGADWNDALDMAGKNGESVAFSAAYAKNLCMLAQILRWASDILPGGCVEMMEELKMLIDAGMEIYDMPKKKRQILLDYCQRVSRFVSGKKICINAGELADILEDMGEWIKQHIRNTEIVGDNEGESWFNSYYDDDGISVEGQTQEGVRMMLTGQVFAILSGTAQDKQIVQIIRAADKYLYDKAAGGYRLNTDFKEVKMNLGRMFGFAYGHKENGAVFCHMAVMYAYALYVRGFVGEGYKVLQAMFEQSINTKVSRMYPGIPEYFDASGRGMYPYLTGAASWMILAVQTQMYGVRGELGELVLQPKLLLEQFDKMGNAEITCGFCGRWLHVKYVNSFRREIGDYELTEVVVDGTYFECSNNYCKIPKEFIEKYDISETIGICGILE